MNVMTPGFQVVAGREDMVRFAVFCSNYHSLRVPGPILKTYTKADFFVGRPSAPDVKPTTEDEGRTLVLPVLPDSPTVYAEVNETGSLTFMLAEEH